MIIVNSRYRTYATFRRDKALRRRELDGLPATRKLKNSFVNFWVRCDSVDPNRQPCRGSLLARFTGTWSLINSADALFSRDQTGAPI